MQVPKRSRKLFLFMFLVIVMLTPMWDVAEAQTDDWIRIQNSSQGYALSCPKNAVVRRYDPEGVVRIEVPDSFTLTIHIYENSDRLSAEEWIDKTIVNGQVEDDYKVGPPAAIVSRGKTLTKNQPAETLLLSSGDTLSRRTVLATAERMYRIDYTAGDEEGETILESIVASFEPGDFLHDLGAPRGKTAHG